MATKNIITTKLNGSEKQVAWAQDIRERAVASIEYEIEQAKAQAEEARTRYADNPKRARTIARKQELAEKAEREGAILIVALGDVEDAKFFINNRDRLGSIRNVLANLTIDGYLDNDMNRLHPIAADEPETETIDETTETTAMRRELRVVFSEGTPDMLGNDSNIETSVAFIGAETFITMTFGGRDGMQRDSITLDELRDIFGRIGIDC